MKDWEAWVVVSGRGRTSPVAAIGKAFDWQMISSDLLIGEDFGVGGLTNGMLRC